MMFARLLSKIYKKKSGVVLIDSEGQKYICGKPDLNFPEAYIRGEIKIENASLIDFLNLTFENIGRDEFNVSGYFIK